MQNFEVVSDARAHVARVGQERREEEQAGQEVLALGHPGHGLHPQGVQGEEGGGDWPASFVCGRLKPTPIHIWHEGTNSGPYKTHASPVAPQSGLPS